jgi:RNA-directed DNA polymerase
LQESGASGVCAKEDFAEIHPSKSKIVYCKDANRRADIQEITFDFLGYTFRPRRCIDKLGRIHPNFLPAISNNAMKAIRQEIRSRHIQLQNDKSLLDLSKKYAVLQGWYNYYGKFYASCLNDIWKHFNLYLVQWVRRKYKRFAGHKRRAAEYVTSLAKDYPDLFIHWKLGVYPKASSGSRMS